VLLSSCSPAAGPAIESSSKLYSLFKKIYENEADPPCRLCVRLRIKDLAGDKEIVYQMGTSDVLRWAVCWFTDTVVLFSSDIGTKASETRNGTVVERLASNDEREADRVACEKIWSKTQLLSSAEKGSRQHRPGFPL